MDVNRVLPVYHRLRLQQSLQRRLSDPPLSASEERRDTLFADTVVSTPRENIPPAPQGLGEALHAPFDEKRPEDPVDNDINVADIQQDSAGAAAEYAHFFRVYANQNSSDKRKSMENHVRRAKRAHKRCPFLTAGRQCGKLLIRCGDRTQYSVRESDSQQHRPHLCNYDPNSHGSYVLIVDDDRHMREFCRNSFALFLEYDDSKIFTAGSVAEAIDMLKRSKVHNQHIGLVISDIVMPGQSGYDFVNELYVRNYNVEILLMKEPDEQVAPPDVYTGSIEILPYQPFVSGTLLKPFHSDMLIGAVRKLAFGSNLVFLRR